MRFLDMAWLAFNSLTHRKLRTGLAVLGIVIGVVSVVALLSIGQGLRNNITSRLGGLGTNQITITPGFSRAGGNGGFRPPDAQDATTTQATNLTLSDVRAVRGTPGVELVNSVVTGSRVTVTFRGQKANLAIQGVDTTVWSQMVTAQLQGGRYLQPGDTNVAVVGSDLAGVLFNPGVGLNQAITVNGQSVNLIGILQPNGGFGGGGDTAIFVPQAFARTVFGTPSDVVNQIVARFAIDGDAAGIQANITLRLLANHHVTAAKQDFSVRAPSSAQATVQSFVLGVEIFLGIVGFISLLVAAIAVANTMFTVVLERSRQIGILKAVGASSNEVMLMFLFESGLMGFIGGVLGCGVGLALAWLLSNAGLPGFLPGGGGRGGAFRPGGGAGAGTFSLVITPDLLVIAIALATIIGALAGVVPAIRASRLQPVETLRSE